MATSDTQSYETGDVVVVPFPYSDRFAEKRRPALVVSNSRLAGQGFLWIVMITSAIHRRVAHDVTIKDMASAGLTARSIVRPTKIANVEPSRILRRAGKLRRAEMASVIATVLSFIEIGAADKDELGK